MYNYTRLPVSGEGKLFCPCWQAGERIQMRSQMNQALFQRWVAGAVSAVVVFAAGAVSAEDIALNNPSFELPAVPFPTDPISVRPSIHPFMHPSIYLFIYSL